MGGLDHGRVLGQPQVVVGAHVEHRLAVAHADMRVLGRGDDSFRLEQPLGADLVELLLQVFCDRNTHAHLESAGQLAPDYSGSFQYSTTLPDFPDRITSKPFSNSV